MKTTELRTAPNAPAFLTGPRSEAKRLRILEAAMRHFAERGYHATRIEDIATELSIAKGSVFQHFGNKEGLFLAAYKKAVASFSAYLDAPPAVTARGFFETLRYWLERTDRLVRENWVPYRVALLGNYGTDLKLRQEINRFLRDRDPYGTAAFVRMGVERGEVRSDIDEEMMVSMIEWTVERFQDALLTEELDPGLFSRQGNRPEKTAARIAQFLELLRSAIATPETRRGALREAGARPEGEGRPEGAAVTTTAGYTFEKDLSSAATIPSSWYRDPHVLSLEQDRIFAKTWQLVGHSEQVSLPGDYFTCVVADEPLVVTRGNDGVAARVLERLPPPRRPGRPRRRPPQGADVRLPRLDVQPGRQAPHDAGVGRRALLREGGAEPAGGSRRDVGTVSLRVPRLDDASPRARSWARSRRRPRTCRSRT